MKYNLPDRVLKDIISMAKEARVEKIILFGSRAKGTNHERSDIDIAVSGGDFDRFYWDINDKAWSLLSFDIIEVDRGINDALKREIERDGIIIYEKDR
ncbi:nucleotidyltransferase domain-containing protein [bacterium 210820-DFI.6.37]|nr:nucleotidyltransferase domain-containing protein [bacterium 210820-DFI.6.37]